MLPKVFIGSATENRELVNILRIELSGYASCITDKKFVAGKSFLTSLLNQCSEVDFGVFILAPDHQLSKKSGMLVPSPRDNVIFELGMSFGALGDDRTFALYPRGQKLELPTDLDGIHHLEYHLDEENPSDGVVSAVMQLIKQFKRHGRRDRKLDAVSSDIVKTEVNPPVISTKIKRKAAPETKRIAGHGIMVSKVGDFFLIQSDDRIERQIIQIAGGEWWNDKNGWKGDEALVQRLIRHEPRVKVSLD